MSSAALPIFLKGEGKNFEIFLYSSKLNSLSLELKVGPPVNIMQSFNFFLLDTFIL